MTLDLKKSRIDLLSREREREREREGEREREREKGRERERELIQMSLIPNNASNPLPVHTTRERPTEPVNSKTAFGEINIPEPENIDKVTVNNERTTP